MNKPLKPKKPSKNDFPPQEFIHVDKWLVEKNSDLILIDPEIEKELFDDGYPNWEKLEELDYEMVHKDSYSYSFIQKIYEIVKQDFEFGNSLDRDGYVMGLIVTIKIKDPNYESKLNKFTRRFDIYKFPFFRKPQRFSVVG